MNQNDLLLLQDSFWRERIFGVRELSEDKIEDRMKNLKLSLPGKEYCVILFAPYLMERKASEIDRFLIRILKMVREEYQSSGFGCYTVLDNYCNIVAVVALPLGKDYHELTPLTQRIASDVMQRCGVDLFVGLGEPVTQIGQLSWSNDSASGALAHKFAFSNDSVISAKDVRRYYNQSDIDFKVHYDWIIGCFYDGNIARMSERLHNLFAAVSNTSHNDLDSIHNACIELTSMLNRIVRELGVDSNLEQGLVYTQIVKLSSIAEIVEWFLSYSSTMMQRVVDARQDKTQKIIDLASEYIESNLNDPELTLQTVSDYVGMSTPYFGSIFYKAKGVHFKEYVNRSRVKRAQTMLVNSHVKVSNLAQSLGFSSPSYFVSVFRKYTGTSPGNYRESIIEFENKE